MKYVMMITAPPAHQMEEVKKAAETEFDHISGVAKEEVKYHISSRILFSINILFVFD